MSCDSYDSSMNSANVNDTLYPHCSTNQITAGILHDQSRSDLFLIPPIRSQESAANHRRPTESSQRRLWLRPSRATANQVPLSATTHQSRLSLSSHSSLSPATAASEDHGDPHEDIDRIKVDRHRTENNNMRSGVCCIIEYNMR